MVRTLIACLAALILAACGDQQRRTGWTYQPPRGAYEARVVYVDDAHDLGFVGLCDAGPVYILKGGDYESRAPNYVLTVDDQRWTLPITYHEHGRMLMVDRFEQQMAIAHATKRIAFQVGNWTEVLTPSPELASFARDCGA